MTRILLPTAPSTFAGVVAFALAVAPVWTASAEGAVPVSAEAQARFEAGVAALRSQDPDRYGLAYREFKAAYAESATWKILGNLGIAAHKIERHGEAIDALEGYLQRGQGEISAKEAAQVRRDLDVLYSEQAAVTLEVPEGTFWVTDTRTAETGPVINDYGPFEGRAQLRVRAGGHAFQVERPGSPGETWSITLLPGDAATHVFPMPEPAIDEPSELAGSAQLEDWTDVDQPSASHAASYALWGSGALGAVATTVMLVQASNIQSDADADFRRNCPGGAVEIDSVCGRTTPGDRNAANWRTAALVTGAGSLAAIIGGTVVYWLQGQSERDDASDQSSGRVSPWFSGRAVGLEGTF